MRNNDRSRKMDESKSFRYKNINANGVLLNGFIAGTTNVEGKNFAGLKAAADVAILIVE